MKANTNIESEPSDVDQMFLTAGKNIFKITEKKDKLCIQKIIGHNRIKMSISLKNATTIEIS